ncbi:PE family protein, partial [Mycobacterium basiliense]
MSFVSVTPELLTVAASDVARITTSISAANSATAVSTTGMVAAAEDEVSVAIAALFGTFGREYQAISSQLTRFQDQFAQMLASAGTRYGATEAAGLGSLQSLLDGLNNSTVPMLGRPLVGNGADGSAGTGAAGGAAGLLIGNGGAGGSG